MKRTAKRTTIIGVPVPPKHKERMQQVARSEGRTLAGWARRLLLKAVEEAGR